MKSRISAGDKEFLERFRTVVAEHYSDTRFTTHVAAERVAMSRLDLNRKLRKITGQSTRAFIRAMRLGAARDLLLHPLPIEFIAATVGFKGRSHFARKFREEFGATPSTFRAMQLHPREALRRKQPGK